MRTTGAPAMGAPDAAVPETAAAFTAKVAVADLLLSCTEVALMPIVLGFGAVPGAVYKPVLGSMLPQLLLQPVMLQVTDGLVALVTVALNRRAPPAFTDCGGLLMLTEIAAGTLTVTVAVPTVLLSACDVAVTVTWIGLGTVAGECTCLPR